MKFDLKSIVAGIFIGSIGLTSVYAGAASNAIEVFYNIKSVSVQDKEITFPEDKKPFIYKDTAYAPIKEIGEALDSGVIYNEQEKSISLYSKDKAKLRLLYDAIDRLGAVSPEKAIDIWSQGLIERNAAIQYAVMTDALKESYVKSLEENGYDFWITGVSSPWVESYEISDKVNTSDIKQEYHIKYNTKTSEGSYHFNVTLLLIKDGDYWKIEDIAGDEESSAYTGYFK
ncbi:stalk domain-containing protein [Anaeropeptidivorans aminofermentans]|jgi:hypothetical protein|uniref:stalk domain-containing protein n=1 Tax=Anaeropeptidivorans aminofermentans TaxID=2934315 RepID=UPI002023D47D|nr:hypothetical protein [Anaeropeptidivorans aminofermentans]MBE6012637.1 hypothetical protein [Lachnospiraceae bacterium]